MIAQKLDDVEKEWTGLLDPTVEEDDLSWETQSVYLSVRGYNLNAASPIDARVESQNDCKRRINKIIKLMSDKENNYMLNPKLELSAVAKVFHIQTGVTSHL